MTLDLSMTLGDLVVAGSVATAIVGSYFALKNQLTNMHKDLTEVKDQIEEHELVLTDHGEGIAALETKVFGRRRSDNHGRRH